MALPFTSLDAVTDLGPGDSRDFGELLASHCMLVTVSGNSGTSEYVTVYLQGSHDGVKWADMSVVNVNTSPGYNNGVFQAVGDLLVRYVRADYRATVVGGSPPVVTATIASART
jgi:hypothetical protein